jgi:hypothetical protein
MCMSAHPWKFYEKSVGLWAIDSNHSVYKFPLRTKDLDIEGVAREYFHYFDTAMAAMRDLFVPTAIHYPPGQPVAESPMPLDLNEAKEKLLQVWKNDVKGCELWAPGALIMGLTSVSVRNGEVLMSAELPDLLRIMFIAMPQTDHYTLALVTNSDIWLDRTIEDGDNSGAGTANSARLARALEGLELALDGKIKFWNSEYESVPVSERGFSLPGLSAK